MENPLMAYYVNLLALPERRYFRLFGTLVEIVGALHGLQLALHLLWSIKLLKSFATAAGLQDMLSVQGDHFAVHAAMVVVNCWVSPALDYLMRVSDSRSEREASMRHVAKEDVAVSVRERTICVTVDTLLTIMTCLALPAAIFVPYVRVFDTGWLSLL
ncbi:hypothetical protein PI125_g19035 [Phytophthora idaei]|nr:hypothetical protein PI125_g19035 [Phytophthora idaei]